MKPPAESYSRQEWSMNSVESAVGAILEQQLSPWTLPARRAAVGDHSGSRCPSDPDGQSTEGRNHRETRHQGHTQGVSKSCTSISSFSVCSKLSFMQKGDLPLPTQILKLGKTNEN